MFVDQLRNLDTRIVHLGYALTTIKLSEWMSLNQRNDFVRELLLALLSLRIVDMLNGRISLI